MFILLLVLEKDNALNLVQMAMKEATEKLAFLVPKSACYVTLKQGVQNVLQTLIFLEIQVALTVETLRKQLMEVLTFSTNCKIKKLCMVSFGILQHHNCV